MTSIARQVAALQELPMDKLKKRWRALYGTEPPAYNRAHLVKRLAYRIQELAYGGLSEFTKMQLRERLEERRLGIDAGKGVRGWRSKPDRNLPVAGTRLVREWNGDRYEVTVVRGGLEFQGRLYRSLSSVAYDITGSHRNGPSFFGLREPKRGTS